MESIWETDAPRVRFDILKENKSTDVLIIGVGIAGILCAYKLKNAGVDCILVEATEICGGITKNTTAKITLQHGLIYDKMIRRFVERAESRNLDGIFHVQDIHGQSPFAVDRSAGLIVSQNRKQIKIFHQNDGRDHP